jgi:endo-1,4-beta-xylanase
MSTGGSTGAGGTGGSSGGTTGSGGATGSGGIMGSGGVTGNGGITGNGGATGNGGITGNGGATSSGGFTGSGGVTSSGGAPGSGGSTGTSGAAGAGGGRSGSAGAGGARGSGGVTGTGGSAGATGAAGGSAGGSAGATGAAGGSAGAGGAGGAASTCPVATPLTGGMQYCATSGTGTADGNYTYNLYSSGQGTGCINVYGVAAAFKATWTNVGDWIGRVGLAFDQTKTYDKIGTFSSDFAYTTTGITTGGFGNVGVYGWSTNPLHEYYIEENWLGKRPDFTPVTTFTIDGEGTYDVMTNMQKDQPNITGTNADFVQFWSVRQTPRLCGHISISKHFAEWASLGLQLGNLEEARILVEAQNNSGTIDFTTATVVVQ